MNYEKGLSNREIFENLMAQIADLEERIGLLKVEKERLLHSMNGRNNQEIIRQIKDIDGIIFSATNELIQLRADADLMQNAAEGDKLLG